MPFYESFLATSKAIFKSLDKGTHYNPMKIKSCLSLASKSKSCYKELRNSNILRLPSTRPLRDYKKLITPHAEFQEKVIQELQLQTNS